MKKKHSLASKKLVISQPMFFPWVGFFEKILLADLFLYDDDVYYPKGAFSNRVQIKTSKGTPWLTVPLKKFSHTTQTRHVKIDNSQRWKQNHIERLYQAYNQAPYRKDAITLMEETYKHTWQNILDLATTSVKNICNYYEIMPIRGFEYTSSFNVDARKSERILELVTITQSSLYICGAGNQSVQQRYLDHDTLEAAGIRVEYINYLKTPYPQLHNSFTPYLSVLDLIANTGKNGRKYFKSKSKHWKLSIKDGE
jgi:hypothetical protein